MFRSCMCVCVCMCACVCFSSFVWRYLPCVCLSSPLCLPFRSLYARFCVCARASTPHHLTVSTPPPQGRTASDVTASRITVQVATIYGPCENYKVGMQQFLGTHTGHHHALESSTDAPTMIRLQWELLSGQAPRRAFCWDRA